MEPPHRKLWCRVPGYDSDDETSDEDAEAKVGPVAKERLREVVQQLGENWEDHPLLTFQAPPSRSKKDPMPRGVVLSPLAPCFRIEHTDAPVVRDTLMSNGLAQTSGKDWIIQWSGPNMKDSVYQELNEFQRVNHFPGSTELTRKDRLWMNFHDMAQTFGSDAFDFVPQTFVLPEQVQEFLEVYERKGGLWIVKPHASSRGRGIFVLRDVSELPLNELSVVSQYVEDPLLIQGLKFDLRVYVLVTCYDPLRAYIYREGLVRFASKPYSTDEKHLSDAYRHLTNYSINKAASNFVENSQLQADNVGHKWSVSALNKHLKCVGVDVELMWSRIMDLIVKSLLSVEPVISARTKLTAPYSQNCFELYGFDVLVDSGLKPWLLEVNLSPSMQAESPLDWQIKSSLLSDSFNLVGINRVDRQRLLEASRSRAKVQMQRTPGKIPGPEPAKKKVRPVSGRASVLRPDQAMRDDVHEASFTSHELTSVALGALDTDELKGAAQALMESTRLRNFIRLFPTRRTVKHYANITDSQAAMKPWPRGRKPAVEKPSSSQLLAALLFGPPPNHGSTMTLPSRQHPLIGSHLLRRRLMLASEGSGEDAGEEATPASSSSRKLGLSAAFARSRSTPSFALGEAAREGRRRGGKSEPDEAMVALQQHGCRLVMLEYLIRLGNVCSRLSPAERSRVGESKALGRLEAFQRGLEATNSQPAEEDEGEDKSDSVDKLITSTRLLITRLLGEVSSRDGESTPPDSPRMEECGLPLMEQLPASFTRIADNKAALQRLAGMGSSEIEKLLKGSTCDPEIRALLDPYGDSGRKLSKTLPAGAAARAVLRRSSTNGYIMRSSTMSAAEGSPKAKQDGNDVRRAAPGPLSEILCIPLSMGVKGSPRAARSTSKVRKSVSSSIRRSSGQETAGQAQPVPSAAARDAEATADRTETKDLDETPRSPQRTPSPPSSVFSDKEQQVQIAAAAAAVALKPQTPLNSEGRAMSDVSTRSRPTSGKASLSSSLSRRPSSGRPSSGYRGRSGTRPNSASSVASAAAVAANAALAGAMALPKEGSYDIEQAAEVVIGVLPLEMLSRPPSRGGRSKEKVAQLESPMMLSPNGRKRWPEWDIEL
eukprot:TRINITY_DN76130_c0_g1_i1.p1 TRINITY_DN76130_c0_g1~~TRINITY_DN76130_c0_g1_i1.p1  ORF type:complete len:1109 (-),score=215.05 TRINITY_DN76130_c0_g1_i1:33-3359(-)